MDLGTVLTILMLLVPIAASLIEKILKNAGRIDDSVQGGDSVDPAKRGTSGSGKTLPGPYVHDVEPAYVPSEELRRKMSEFESNRTVVTAAVDLSESEAAKELLKDGYRSVKDIAAERNKPGSIAGTPEKKPFVVDKKNLVVYSEIMTPKFIGEK